MAPQRRLNQILNELRPNPPILGILKFGDIVYEIPAALAPRRLPRTTTLLEPTDGNLENLHFMLQKYLLGQDIFLVSQPGPYARRLALTFVRWAYYLFRLQILSKMLPSLINAEYEYITLHRDVGETELKQVCLIF